MDKPELGTDIGLVVGIGALVLSVATPIITSMVIGKDTSVRLKKLEEDLLNARLEAVAAKGKSEAFEEGLTRVEKQQDIMHIESKAFQEEMRTSLRQIYDRIPQRSV